MVTGGITSSDEPLPLVEVFPGGFFQDRDLSANYRFSCPSLPSSRYGHAQAGLEVCGGQDQDTSTNCQTFANGTWVVPQIDPSVPQPVVQSRRRPLLGPSPG